MGAGGGKGSEAAGGGGYTGEGSWPTAALGPKPTSASASGAAAQTKPAGSGYPNVVAAAEHPGRSASTFSAVCMVRMLHVI